MIKVQLDSNNLPIGFYDDTHTVDDIPAGAIEITEEQRTEFMMNQGLRVWNSATQEVDVYTLPITELRATKKGELGGAYVAAVAAGFTTNNIKMDASPKDVESLSNGYDLAVELSELDMVVRTFDNQIVTAQVAAVATMISELKINARMLATKKWDLQQQVDTANSQNELDLIVW